jgi:tyrosine-protein phosphatase YwqE
MFSFFKKRAEFQAGAFEGLACDLHSHLIPGIDDGAPDLDTSIRLIRGLMELGYKKIITTPHSNGSGFPNTPEIIRAGEAQVVAELRRQQLSVELHAAAEHLIDDRFTEALEAGRPFLTLKDNLILVELSFVVPAINLKEVLFDLQLKGYLPVLAHPERYLYFKANKAWFDELRNLGCLFQLNLLSFTGYYGREVRELADYLVKKKYIDFLGTDLHHERQLKLLGSSPRLERRVGKLLDTGLIRNAQL